MIESIFQGIIDFCISLVGLIFKMIIWFIKSIPRILVGIYRLIRRHPGPTLILLILILAAFLRIYRISDYMTFLGDEGRDVLVAKEILHGHFTLLGPRSSAGDFFMGPAYYYFITPFLWLFNYDPVGPAIMVALFGVATVYLIYIVGK